MKGGFMPKHLDITNAIIIEILKTPGSLAKKARELGVSQGLFHQRSRADQAVKDALEKWRTLPRLPYPTKIIPPKRVGGWEVLKPAEKRGQGSAYWRIQHTKCGKIREISGSELVRKPPSTCRNCRGSSLTPGECVGDWKVLKQVAKRWNSRAAFWRAQHLICGVVRTFTTSGLKRQAKQECWTCRRKQGHKSGSSINSRIWKNGGFL